MDYRFLGFSLEVWTFKFFLFKIMSKDGLIYLELENISSSIFSLLGVSILAPASSH